MQISKLLIKSGLIISVITFIYLLFFEFTNFLNIAAYYAFMVISLPIFNNLLNIMIAFLMWLFKDKIDTPLNILSLFISNVITYLLVMHIPFIIFSFGEFSFYIAYIFSGFRILWSSYLAFLQQQEHIDALHFNGTLDEKWYSEYKSASNTNKYWILFLWILIICFVFYPDIQDNRFSESIYSLLNTILHFWIIGFLFKWFLIINFPWNLYV